MKAKKSIVRSLTRTHFMIKKFTRNYGLGKHAKQFKGVEKHLGTISLIFINCRDIL